MKPDFENHSLRWKMYWAYELASCLSFVPGEGRVTRDTSKAFGKKNDELIWAHCEGDQFKYFEKMSTCRCSLKAMTEFDIEKYEKKIEDAILKFISLLEKAGEEIPEPPLEDEVEKTNSKIDLYPYGEDREPDDKMNEVIHMGFE